MKPNQLGTSTQRHRTNPHLVGSNTRRMELIRPLWSGLADSDWSEMPPVWGSLNRSSLLTYESYSHNCLSYQSQVAEYLDTLRDHTRSKAASISGIS